MSRCSTSLLLDLVLLLGCGPLRILQADDEVGPDQEYDRLSWFVHITDIHVSSWEDESRQTELQQFVRDSLGVIRPALVVCGGDLTEAKPSPLQARQDEAEWRRYRDILATRWSNIPWLDIRGNHDNLNVLSRNSSTNYFSRYSVQGPAGNLESYSHSLAHRGQRFNFIAVDATLDVGMNYPFNFIGNLNGKQQGLLDQIVTNTSQKDVVNILFGHYPSSVVRQTDYLRSLMSQGLVYLSGHLHDLYHGLHNLYTFHAGDNLELELVDWKNNRMFRVFAVDDGKFSFTDLRHGDWPVVLVTHPKDTRYMMASKEDYSVLYRNTVRLLVFSPVNITRVTVAVDGESPVEAGAVQGGPLYTMPWDGARHISGRHSLTVNVLDSNQRTKTIMQEFTLNPKQAEQVNSFWPNFILRSSFASLFHTLYILSLLLNLVVAAVFKVCHYAAQSGRLLPPHLSRVRRLSRCCLVRKLLLVCSYNKLFIPLLCFVLYMAIGPWVVGRIIEGRLGAVFAWGAVVAGTIVPTQDTFIYFFFHFALIHPFMVLFIGELLDWRNHSLTSSGRPGRIVCCSSSGCLVFVLAGSIFLSITFWLQFGVLGIFLGPLKTWSYLFYGVMCVLAWRVPALHCRQFNTLFSNLSPEKKSDDAEEDERLSLRGSTDVITV